MTWKILIPLGSNFPLSWRVSAIITVVCGAWTDYGAGCGKPRGEKAVQQSARDSVGNAMAPTVMTTYFSWITQKFKFHCWNCWNPPFPRPWKVAISHPIWLLGRMSINTQHDLFHSQSHFLPCKNRKLGVVHCPPHLKMYTIALRKQSNWRVRVLFFTF